MAKGKASQSIDLVAARDALKAADKKAQASGTDADKSAAAKALEALLVAKTELRTEWGRQAFTRSTIGLLVLGAVLGAIGLTRHSDGAQAFGWTAPILCLVLILTGWAFIGRQNGGIVGLMVGADNRFSTSLVQVALWTIAIVFAFGMFVAQTAFGVDLSKGKNGFGSFDEKYLFLLGGPFAAALLAKFIAVTKSDAQTVQQTEADVPTAKDVVSDHTGTTSLADTQFFLFNLVALAYFAVSFSKHLSELPVLNSTLVGLTSISALTYVGGKVVNSNPPTITSVSIISGGNAGKLVPGATIVRIIGKNLLPGGTDKDKDLETTVLFGSTEVVDLSRTSDTEVRAVVPVGLAPGKIEISVRTATGSTAEPWKELEVAGAPAP